MTIGKNSRKGSTRSSIRAPKFLDKSSGFYGRLDEPETAADGEEVRGNEVEERGNGNEDGSRERSTVSCPAPNVVQESGADEKEETEAFDFNEGVMEDDGETLLRRKPSRRSSRWRRSSRRKQKEGKIEEDAAQDERPSLGKQSPAEPHGQEGTGVMTEVEMEKLKKMGEDNEKAGRGKEPVLVHFPVREDEDDQVLIRDKKRGREEEGEEERRMKREQEEGMKVVKRTTMKNYRKLNFLQSYMSLVENVSVVSVLANRMGGVSQKGHKKQGDRLPRSLPSFIWSRWRTIREPLPAAKHKTFHNFLPDPYTTYSLTDTLLALEYAVFSQTVSSQVVRSHLTSGPQVRQCRGQSTCIGCEILSDFCSQVRQCRGQSACIESGQNNGVVMKIRQLCSTKIAAVNKIPLEMVANALITLYILI
ncbi:putative neurofilament medium polypeptide-like [Scophthalmus maximus]|uniref:Putative neurofilament medium polypeptide-like n=1 Tax=Scophthalmus maximus TaxID=52904 RepID=A0A2U9BAP0_SCOMX|nr:putative neurofilament medium polypeptide-like [Scophthalmus maximus]